MSQNNREVRWRRVIGNHDTIEMVRAASSFLDGIGIVECPLCHQENLRFCCVGKLTSRAGDIWVWCASCHHHHRVQARLEANWIVRGDLSGGLSPGTAEWFERMNDLWENNRLPTVLLDSQ